MLAFHVNVAPQGGADDNLRTLVMAVTQFTLRNLVHFLSQQADPSRRRPLLSCLQYVCLLNGLITRGEIGEGGCSSLRCANGKTCTVAEQERFVEYP